MFFSNLKLPQNEEVAGLVQKLRLGSITKIEKKHLISIHMRLAIAIAYKYSQKFPYKSEDLVAEALYILVMATEKAITRCDDYSHYITSCIYSRLSKYLREDRNVRIPASSYQKLKKLKGIPTEFGTGSEFGKKEHARVSKVIFKQSERLKDLKEILQLSIRNNIEAKIIDMRMKAFNDQEIAKELKKSNSYVHLHRTKVGKRFERYKS